MDEIKIEFVADSDKILWQQYFDLCQEISRKYYKKGYEPDKTPEEFRESIRGNSYNLSVLIESVQRRHGRRDSLAPWPPRAGPHPRGSFGYAPDHFRRGGRIEDSDGNDLSTNR